jgi:hypothetical protein
MRGETMEALTYEVKDKKLSDLIDVIGRYFGCEIESRIQVEVKGANSVAAEMLRIILVDGDTMPIEFARREKPAVSVTKRPGQAMSWKEERNANMAKKDQAAEKAGFGYCRNCGEKVEHEKWGKFCKVECRNQYNVRKCYLRKDKGMEIDTMITWMDEKGKHKYFTEDEFAAALRTTGLFPEGARLVTPEGHLRKVVMQAGQMT